MVCLLEAKRTPIRLSTPSPTGPDFTSHQIGHVVRQAVIFLVVLELARQETGFSLARRDPPLAENQFQQPMGS
jgi:hypothetical protein